MQRHKTKNEQGAERTLNEYQKAAHETAVYPTCYVDSGDESTGLVAAPWIYPAIGLAGEVGEVSEKLKKVIRDSHGLVSPEVLEGIVKELGDALWYIAETAQALNVDLSYVANENIKKLASRSERGALSGSGDNR